VDLVEPQALTRELARQGVLSLVGTRIESLAGPAVLEPLREVVHATVWHHWRVGLLHEGVTAMVTSQLQREGVASLPLKGVSLARAIYGDPGLRGAQDIDLLVASAELETAVSILVRAGYCPPRDPIFANGRPILHYALVDPSGRYPTIELHWRVHWYESSFSQALLEGARPDAEGMMRADPAHEIAALLLFYARDGFIGLRLAADIAAWWDAYGENLAGRSLEPLLDRHPQLREVLTTSVRVAEQTVGLPATRLISARRPSGRSATAQRLANWNQSGKPGQVGAVRTLIDALVTPRGGVRALLRRNVFPPSSVFARWYSLSPEARARMLFWRIAHPPKLLCRYLIALLVVRNGRSWAAVPPSAAPPGRTV